jgi:Predicted membrane protein (DUF2254)
LTHLKEKLESYLSRICSYVIKKLWPNVVYWASVLLILFIVYLSVIMFLDIFLGFNGSAESARYLLSAIGQSSAAVLALSFTIPLIILQQVASKYGIKVYDLYFDRYTVGFMLLAVLSIVFPFFVLSRLSLEEDKLLTPDHGIWVTIALLLLIFLLFFLILFIKHLMEKSTLKYIINSYVQQIENLISKGELASAHEKVNTLKGIGIAAAREREDMVFGDFLTAWFDLLMLEKIAWIKNVLVNSLPDIFKIVAAEDETTAKKGLDKLQVIVLNSVEKNEIEKAKRVVGLFPWIIGPLVNTYPEIVRHSFNRLREIGQMSIIMSKSEEAFEIPTKAIQALRNIGEGAVFTKPELTNDAIYEISNIVHQHLTGREIVKKGINAIAGLNRDNLLVEDVLSIPNPQEVKTKANNELLHILDSISTRFFTNMNVKYKIEIAELIVPSIDIYSPEEASRLIIIASRFLKDDEGRAKELLNKIAKNIKETDTKNIAEGIDLAKKCSSEFDLNFSIEEFERRYLKLE